ncbi:MAG: ABC transporter permease [Spirochaetaceae bacterium]|nr:MAG: ABC transporter permease [Spirochaetaceae bacterium]
MLSFIFRRILWLIPVLLVISMITFALMLSVPGNPFEGTGERPLPPETVARLRAHYGLDDSIPVQYLRYMQNLLRGDLGPSYATRRSVNDMVAAGLPISATLGMLGLVVALSIGIPLGVASALNQNRAIDHFAMFFAMAGVSVPAMTSAPLFIWIFSINLGWLPVARWGTWQQAVMPAIILGIGPAAVLARLTRASMLQVIREDYIRTARAKGVPERRITIQHALKNALIPVITVLGPLFASMVTGAVVVERIFAIPGMGGYFVGGVSSRDYPVIMGMVLVYTFFLVLSNLAVDLAYAWVDPRIRLE